MTKLPNQKLTPLVEDPTQPSYVRELIDAGRNARVSGYDFQAGLAAHLAGVESGASMPDWAKDLRPSGAGAATAPTGLATWMTVTTASLVGVAVVAVTAAVMVSSHQEPAMQATEPAAAPQALASAPRPAAVPEPLTRPGAVAVGEGSAQPAAPRAVGTEARPGRPSAARPVARPSLRMSAGRLQPGAAAPLATPPVSAHGSTPLASDLRVTPAASADSASTTAVRQAATAHSEPAPAESAAAAEQPTPAPRPAARAPEDDARLEREMGMLAMAQRVLTSDPERALRLAQQGEAEFPGSMFTEERQQLLLLALVKLGRLDQAKQLAKPYLARFPHGPYSDRVRRALASGSVPR